MKRKKPLRRSPDAARRMERRAREKALAREVARAPRTRGRGKRKLPGSVGWTKRVFALYGRHCLACKRSRQRKGLRPRKAVQAHHVVPLQVILGDTRKPRAQREALAYDSRNGMPVCKACHDGHELAAEGRDENGDLVSRRIRRGRIPAGAIDWAVEHDYGYIVDDERVYPCA